MSRIFWLHWLIRSGKFSCHELDRFMENSSRTNRIDAFSRKSVWVNTRKIVKTFGWIFQNSPKKLSLHFSLSINDVGVQYNDNIWIFKNNYFETRFLWNKRNSKSKRKRILSNENGRSHGENDREKWRIKKERRNIKIDTERNYWRLRVAKKHEKLVVVTLET